MSRSSFQNFTQPRIISRWISSLLLLGLAGAGNASGQSPQSAYDQAVVDWDEGNFDTALSMFERILNTQGNDAFFDDIALLTGELFQTVEVAEWGTNPVWSADGPYFIYDVPGESGTVTKLMSFNGNSPRELGSIEGKGAQLIATGTAVAYLKVNRSAEFESRQQALLEAITERTRAAFNRYQRQVQALEAEFSSVMIRDIASGEEREVRTSGLGPSEIKFHPAGEKMFIVAGEIGVEGVTDIYELTAATLPRKITGGSGVKGNLEILSDEQHAVFTIDGERVAILNLETGQADVFNGHDPVVSANGRSVAYLDNSEGMNRVFVVRVGGESTMAFESEGQVENLALSPDGSTVVFQNMIRENWELMVVSSGTDAPRQLTHDVQHDLFPQFLNANTVLSIKGEGRHRRSYLHDLETGASTRLFHNNTVRTVAPEYEWAVDRTGRRILIVSERDGDTISPERGLYMVDLDKRVTRESLITRLAENRDVEARLKQNGERLFGPIRASASEVTGNVSTSRIYGYEADLFAFGSKFITQPGNAMAIEYLTEKLRSFGYEPELQTFEPRPGVQTSNVIATLTGSVDPNLIYVISSHFDSVERGPGADDNTSGTAALLEAARVMASSPQPATVKFAFFTGEEAGLLGSREFVRRAVADGDHLVGALNNDMVGYANNNRLDNTIRYSNDGIRDIQHGAAMLFSNLITYDARYYKNTDAHAYFEAYGDIVGGIGSYPILANPHYHQTHDVLETINHQLVAEVSKTTVATIMLLASSPSRLTDVRSTRSGETVKLEWAPAVESGITGYEVEIVTDGLPDRIENTDAASISISDVSLRAKISVRAINGDGMPGWSGANVTDN